MGTEDAGVAATALVAVEEAAEPTPAAGAPLSPGRHSPPSDLPPLAVTGATAIGREAVTETEEPYEAERPPSPRPPSLAAEAASGGTAETANALDTSSTDARVALEAPWTPQPERPLSPCPSDLPAMAVGGVGVSTAPAALGGKEASSTPGSQALAVKAGLVMPATGVPGGLATAPEVEAHAKELDAPEPEPVPALGAEPRSPSPASSTGEPVQDCQESVERAEKRGVSSEPRANVVIPSGPQHKDEVAREVNQPSDGEAALPATSAAVGESAPPSQLGPGLLAASPAPTPKMAGLAFRAPRPSSLLGTAPQPAPDAVAARPSSTSLTEARAEASGSTTEVKVRGAPTGESVATSPPDFEPV